MLIKRKYCLPKITFFMHFLRRIFLAIISHRLLIRLNITCKYKKQLSIYTLLLKINKNMQANIHYYIIENEVFI